MTQEDKELLLKDLCGRLPYNVKVQNITEGRKCIKGSVITISKYVPYSVHVLTDFASGNQEYSPIEHIKPYLRSVTSMTEEEKIELYNHYCQSMTDFLDAPKFSWDIRICITDSFGVDWLNAHHFDYRGLISKGLALEAPKDMYKI